jgi:uncharacterized protein YraI
MRLILISFFMMLMPWKAMAADAFAVTSLHMRAGPHSGLPVISTLQRNERVELLGCVDGYQWCEVRTSYDEYGWVSSNYLRLVSGTTAYGIIDPNGYGRTRIIIYKPRDYWDRHYRNKNFYRDRDRWFRDDDRGHSHGNGNHDHDYDDEDDHHGHHGGPPRPRPEPVKETPPKYQKMEMPKKSGYNPLCRMGQSSC